MKRPCRDLSRRGVANLIPQSFSQFARRLIRKRDAQNLPRRRLQLVNQVRDASDEHVRLPGPRTREHARRAHGREHRGALVVVQTAHVRRFERINRRFSAPRRGGVRPRARARLGIDRSRHARHSRRAPRARTRARARARPERRARWHHRVRRRRARAHLPPSTTRRSTISRARRSAISIAVRPRARDTSASASTRCAAASARVTMTRTNTHDFERHSAARPTRPHAIARPRRESRRRKRSRSRVFDRLIDVCARCVERETRS